MDIPIWVASLMAGFVAGYCFSGLINWGLGSSLRQPPPAPVRESGKKACDEYLDWAEGVPEELNALVREVIEDPACEVCGETATSWVQDTQYDFEASLRGVNSIKLYGDPHYFCGEHTRESKVVLG